MADLIAELMRKQLAKKLRWHFERSGQLVSCLSPSPSDVEGVEDVSCVLYLGSLKTQADEVQGKAKEIADKVEYWTGYYVKGFPGLLDPHKKPGVGHKAPSWYTEPLVPRLQPRLRFPPLEFPTAVWRGRKVALYSLVNLLGEERARELVSGTRWEAERCVVVKRGRHSVSVEMGLMQLQAYLAKPGP